MAINWTEIFNKYKGLWVALDDDEKTVVAYGETAKDVLKEAQKKGFMKPILSHMPDRLITYIGFGL